MKKLVVLFVVAFAVLLTYTGGSALAEAKEKEAVRIPLENYLKGHETGKAEFMKAAFHDEGHLMFIRDGKYTTISFSDYIGRMKGEAAADEAARKRYIESIDVSGDAAVGKIVLDYPNARFVDYMTLLKIDGEWKIVNKAFHVENKKSDKTE